MFTTHDWELPEWMVVPVGSRITCNPAPQGTDEDFLCLIGKDAAAAERLSTFGFSIEGHLEFYTGNDNGGFRSYRNGDINVITTESREFFDKFRCATELARRFNLLEKADRIALFQAVLYGVDVCNLETK